MRVKLTKSSRSLNKFSHRDLYSITDKENRCLKCGNNRYIFYSSKKLLKCTKCKNIFYSDKKYIVKIREEINKQQEKEKKNIK